MDPIAINRQINQHDYNNIASNSSTYSVWSNFFILAGIPSSVAHEYAVTFSQHRIRIDMLKEITKEILLDMGIKAMGDIIAILRHAKNLYTQNELNGGTEVLADSVTNPLLNQRQIKPDQPTRTQAIPARQSSIISPLVGNKVQSRVSLASGALAASTNNSTSETVDANKRPSTTVSTSLAKRLRPTPGPNIDHRSRALSEKTLTVYYPPSSAIAAAQKRLGLDVNLKQQQNNAVSSVKSRLGVSPKDASRINLESSNHTSIRESNNQHSGRSSSINSPASNRRPGMRQMDQGERGNQRTDIRHQSGRLKSTVFNRLGEGAR